MQNTLSLLQFATMKSVKYIYLGFYLIWIRRFFIYLFCECKLPDNVFGKFFTMHDVTVEDPEGGGGGRNRHAPPYNWINCVF